MTGWILIAVLGVVAVLTLPRVPVWLYHWRAAAHVITMTEAEPVPAPEYLAVPGVVAEAVRTLAESAEHRVRYGSMILDEELALHHEVVLPDRGGWISGPCLAELPEPTAAEVAASRAAHGYIPELDPDAGDLGPGAGLNRAGYNSHLPSGPTSVKVDSPAPVDLPREEGGTTLTSRGQRPATGAGDESEPCGVTAPPAPPTRRATATDVALAQMDAFMAAMKADHAVWMASARERWAAA